MACANDKPKFFINRLPQNQPNLSRTVEPLPFDFSQPKCTFKSRFNNFDTADEPVRRYDRRVFVKVDDSRSSKEWEQHAICNGFTDNKFIPGILRASGDVIGDQMTWHAPQTAPKNEKENTESIDEEEPQSPNPEVTSTVAKPPAVNEKEDSSVSVSQKLQNTPPPKPAVKTKEDVAKTKAARYVPPAPKQNVEPVDADERTESNTVNTVADEDLNKLFFQYLFLEFERLDESRQRAFKKNVIGALYSTD